jgi:hypothetical protein
MAQQKTFPIVQEVEGASDFLEKFNSNPRLKKIGQKIALTQDQITEYTRCASDPEYFIVNYVKIVSTDLGLIPFELRKYQKRMVHKMHRWNRLIMRAARQSGKTQTSAAYILWYILFQDLKTVAILANKQDTSTEILSRVQEMYMHVPLWMQQGIVVWNKTSFLLENGSRCFSAPTSSNAIRGYTISLLYLDEYAHVPNNVALNFFTSVYPTISSGQKSKVIISSTPNGMNHFYKMFMDAKNKKSKFKHITVTWDQVPGRNKLWMEDQKSVMSEEKFLQEQEVEFMGSAGTLISSRALKNLIYVDPVKELFENKFYMYEDVVPTNRYVACCDVSHGKELDYHAISVVDVTSMPYKVVGVYHANDVPAELYPSVIYQIATYYNMAYVLCESNDIGSLVLKILADDLEYENIFYTESDPQYKDTKVTTQSMRTAGVRTTPKTKRQGCNALKALVENSQLQIQDFTTISELTTFVIKPNKTYAADEESNDDTVMTLVLFAWLTTQAFFKAMSAIDTRSELYQDHIQNLAHEMPVEMKRVVADPGPKKFKQDGIIWEEVGQSQGDEGGLTYSGYSYH